MRQVVLVVAVMVAAGCKKHEQVPASGSNAAPVAPDLVLPKGTGAPPKPTHAPLDHATVEKLRALAYTRFHTEQLGQDKSVGIIFHTDDHPQLKATVQIRPCAAIMPNGETNTNPQVADTWSCPALDADAYRNTGEAKQFLHPSLAAAKDTVFDVGNTELNGTKMVYIRQIGWIRDDRALRSTDAYMLYFHDDVNEIRVITTYEGNQPETRAQLLQLAPQEDLENLAKAFMDVVTQAWAP
ncbi:MAG: hypothetical protein QM831_35465 [Kofleriaceae bacterium]